MSNDYRAKSKLYYGSEETTMTIDKIQLGCLQRIADATEAMAKNHIELQREYNWMKQRKESLESANNRMARSISSLRGHITRLKKRQTAG